MANMNGSAFLNRPTSGTQGGVAFMNQPGAQQAVADLGLSDKTKENVQDEEEKRKKILEDFIKNNPQGAAATSSMSAIATLFA